jgi:hypothetical protein
MIIDCSDNCSDIRFFACPVWVFNNDNRDRTHMFKVK